MGVKIALVLLCVLPLYCKSMSLAETFSKVRVGDTVQSNEVLSKFRNQTELLQEESDKTNAGKRHARVYGWKRSLIKSNNLQATRNQNSGKGTVQSPVTIETSESVQGHTRKPQKIATRKQYLAKGILKEVLSKGVYFNGRLVDKKGDKGELKDTFSVYKDKHTMESKSQAKYVQGPAKKSRTERSLNTMFDLPPAVIDFLLHISPKDVNRRVFRRNAASLEENEESNTTDRSMKAITTLNSSGDLNKFGKQLQNLHEQELSPNKTSNLLKQQKSYSVQSKDFKDELKTKPGQAKQIRIGDKDSIKEDKKLANVATKNHVRHENTKNYGKREVALGKPKSKYIAGQSNQIGDKEHTKQVEVIATKKDEKNEHIKSNEKLEAMLGKSTSTEKPKSSTGQSKYTIAENIDKLLHELLKYIEREKNTTSKTILEHKNPKSNEKLEISMSEKSKLTEKPKSNPGQSNQIGAKDEIKTHKREVEMKNENIKSNEKQENALLEKPKPTEKQKSNPGQLKQIGAKDAIKESKKQVEISTTKKRVKNENIKSNEKQEELISEKSMLTEKPGQSNQIGDKDAIKVHKMEVEMKNENIKCNETQVKALLGKSKPTEKLKSNHRVSKRRSIEDIGKLMGKLMTYIDQKGNTTSKKKLDHQNIKSNEKEKTVMLEKSLSIEKHKYIPGLQKYGSVGNIDTIIDMLVRVGDKDVLKDHVKKVEDITSNKTMTHEHIKGNGKREINMMGKTVTTGNLKTDPDLLKQTKVGDKHVLREHINKVEDSTHEKNVKQEHGESNRKLKITLGKSKLIVESISNPYLSKYVSVGNTDKLLDMLIKHIAQKEDTTNKTNLEYNSGKKDTKREKDNLGKNVIAEQNSNPGLLKQERDKDMLIKNTNSKRYTTSRKNTKQDNNKSNEKLKITPGKSKLIEESKNPFLSKYKSVGNTDKLMDKLIKRIDQKEDTTNKTYLEHKSGENDTKREKDNLGKNVTTKQNSNPGLLKQVRDKDMLMKNTNSKRDNTSRKNMTQDNSKNYVKRETKLVKPMFTENTNSIAGITKQVKVRDLDFLFDYFISSLKKAGNNVTKIQLVKPLNTVKTPKSSLEKQTDNLYSGEVLRKDGSNYDSQLKKQTDSFGPTKIEYIFI